MRFERIGTGFYVRGPGNVRQAVYYKMVVTSVDRRGCIRVGNAVNTLRAGGLPLGTPMEIVAEAGGRKGSGLNPGVARPVRPAVTALAVVLLVLLAPAGAGAGGSSRTALTALEASTIQSINSVRVTYGLAPLTVSNGLFGSAMLHCRQMVDGGYFSHAGPNGSGFGTRIAAFYPQGRYHFYSVAENLLWTLTPMSSDRMVARWMRSPEHRSNLLNPAWREIAVAVLSADSAPGFYEVSPSRS